MGRFRTFPTPTRRCVRPSVLLRPPRNRTVLRCMLSDPRAVERPERRAMKRTLPPADVLAPILNRRKLMMMMKNSLRVIDSPRGTFPFPPWCPAVICGMHYCLLRAVCPRIWLFPKRRSLPIGRTPHFRRRLTGFAPAKNIIRGARADRVSVALQVGGSLMVSPPDFRMAGAKGKLDLPLLARDFQLWALGDLLIQRQ